MALSKIETAGIGDNAITSDKILSGAVSAADIEDSTITAAKLHSTLDLSGKTVTMPSNSIGSGNISDGAITDGKLASTLDLSGKTVTLPAGTGGKVLQVATDTLEGVISGSYTTGSPTTITNGVEVFSVSFTPISASSTILVMTSTVALSEDANVGDVWWLALWDGSTFVASNSGTWGYNNFANFRNAAYQSLCHTYSAGSTSARTISVRAGLNGGTTIHQYVNGNAYSNYTGSSARIQMTVMEIAG